jgi:hypothetical protein
MRKIFAVFSVAALSVFTNSAPTLGADQDLQLTFGTLPSAQGFTYVPSGSHAGAVEATIFSVDGTTLTQNSIGQGYGVSGGGILYNYSGIVTATEAKQLLVRARCLQVEGSGIGAAGQQGFAFGFNTGSVQYDISVTPTKVYTLGPGGTVAISGTYDNSTAFHDWLLDFTPPNAFKIYRDGSLIHSGTNGFGVSGNLIFIGDGTGGANAHAEVRSLRFLQGTSVPVELSEFSID